MPGKTEILKAAITLICGVALVTDLWRKKIYNGLTIPAFLSGLLFSIYFGGMHGLADAFLGALAGAVLYGWMFWVGVMGAGDVKLMMALGAWGGLRFSVEVALLGVLVGGVMALLMLVFSGRFAGFLKRAYAFWLRVTIKELEIEPMKIDRSYKMPFGVPIAVAAVWIVFASPYVQWGVRLWG